MTLLRTLVRYASRVAAVLAAAILAGAVVGGVGSRALMRIVALKCPAREGDFYPARVSVTCVTPLGEETASIA